jgi:aminopeptidase N
MMLAAMLVTLVLGVGSPYQARRLEARPTDDSLMAPGVSLALARHRAAQIRDVRYLLTLDVTHTDTASGHVVILFRARPREDVILDFRGPRLGRTLVNGRAVPNVEFNGHHLRLPARFLRADSNRVELGFSALIAPAGASIIRVRDPSDGATYLYTLLVPSDAEQLFPCFDQPDLKARVELSLTTPSGWSALANGAAQERDSSARGTTFHFARTEPISTYLIAFAAGPWTALSARGMNRSITLYVRRSRAKEVDTDSILHDGDRAVQWLERYFDRRYAFHKLDFLLAPAFPFGGMEHPGAIFFSEERFVFREPPTLPQRLGRTATVYHEVAHQWFGDLVTMRWFDDLWLKEGFATYMAAKMQAALDPASDAWKTFYLRNKPLAYAVDVTEGTTPIWQSLGNLDQAKSNYGAIVYNKAPAVLKQLNFLVGDDAFRAGLRRFISAHAFGNATWRDLLDAVGTAWGHSLRPWGDQYIVRPGMPILTQHVDVRDGRIRRLTITQQPARALSGTRPWPIRTTLQLTPASGTPWRLPLAIVSDTVLVREAAGRPAPAWTFANAGDNAYALVLLDSSSVAWLERSLSRVSDPFERALVWGALWDLVRDASLSPARFIDLARRELPAERDEQIAAVVLGRLTRAYLAYLPLTRQQALAPVLERVLLEGAADTTRAYGIRRAHLDALVRLATSASALSVLDAMLDSARYAALPIGPPTRWAIVTHLIARSAPSAERRLAAEIRRDASAEGARRAFVAGAARPSGDVKRAYFTRYFADTALNEDWATASLDAFNGLEARALTLPFLRPALDSLPWIQRNRRIFYLGSWIGAFVEGQVDDEALTVVRDYLGSRRDLAPDLRAKVLQSVDELERTVRIRKSFSFE